MARVHVLTIAVVVIALVAAGAQAQWSVTGSLRTARTGHTATALLNGRVLVAGGSDGSGGCLNSAEVFDPVSQTWTTTGAMTAARCGHAAVLIDDGSGRVLVTGGVSANGTYLSSIEFYNDATKAWTSGTRDNMRTARAYHAAIRLARGDVLVIGGLGADGYLDSVEQYRVDTATSPWNPVGALKVSRAFHTATLLPNDRILVVGGTTVNGTDTAVGEFCSNLVYCTWVVTVNELGVPRHGHTATLLANGDVLITGGLAGSQPTATTELYDNTRFNLIITELDAPRIGHQTVLLLDDEALTIAGQESVSGGYLAAIEFFNPTQRRWTRGGLGSALNTARAGFTATVLSNGDVLVAGGATQRSAAVATAEVFSQERRA